MKSTFPKYRISQWVIGEWLSGIFYGFKKIYIKVTYKQRTKGGKMNGTDLKIYQGDYTYLY